MAGVKETRDVIKAVEKLAVVVTKHLKDGFQGTDAVAIITELATRPDVQAAVAEARDNIEAVKDEIKDVDVLEGCDLAVDGIGIAKAILTELKAPVAGTPTP